MESYLHIVGGENQMLRRFDIKIITEEFSWSNNDYGHIHKGKLESVQDIIIIGPYPPSEYEYCMNQVSIHVKVEHPNLAELLGWCIEGKNVYLIYDNRHNYATLEDLLSDRSRPPLDWNERCRILLGVALALLYLHKHAPIRVLNCDIRSQRILLDESLDPKLYGFYSAVPAAINKTDCTVFTRIWESGDCLAPEYARRGHVSMKSDVYNFGSLVLETITWQVFKKSYTEIDYASMISWIIVHLCFNMEKLG